MILALAYSLMACNAPMRTATPAPTPTPSTTPTLTPTPVPPSPTPVPLAARVNGEEITLAEVQAEMTRYQSAYGTNLASDWQELVFEDLITQTILAQAAQQQGFVLTDVELQRRIDALILELGTPQALSDWMSAHGYTEQEFRRALERSAASAWMINQITDTVPWSVDQVHARQILLYNSSDANDVLYQLKSGADFITLAYQYDPATGGDLGWFPKGYLTELALEQAAFQIEPGSYSEVIETPLGFHILFVSEHEPQHLLTSDARVKLQEQAVSDWIEQSRRQADVENLVP